MVEIYTEVGDGINSIIKESLRKNCGHLSPQKILIKPNWVIHETDEKYTIDTLITSPKIIEATIVACSELFPAVQEIMVADCPLQSADWSMLCRQSKLDDLIIRARDLFGDRVKFMDLRREVFKVGKNFVFIPDHEAIHGDPNGYKEIMLNSISHLEPISRTNKFSLIDHDDKVTRTFHRLGDHRYLVAQSFLEADLIVNLPKWKTHSKSGLTGALKNLVGINGDKAYLPHFSLGSPRNGGDEYGDRNRLMAWFVSNGKKMVWRRSSLGYLLLKPIGKWMMNVFEKISRSEKHQDQESGLYVSGGNWYGNKTIWRMIYDLNMIIEAVGKDGLKYDEPQRNYFCIVDGLIAGDGDGPLNPNKRELNYLICGSNPFEIDTTLSWLMGFNPKLIPILSEYKSYLGPSFGKVDISAIDVMLDKKVVKLNDIVINHKFIPPRGWINHIERT